MTIQPASVVINWVPAPLTAGAALGSAQMNAAAFGIGGAPVAGMFSYTPGAGTVFTTAGTYSLSTRFASGNSNYADASKQVSLNVANAMTFSGFYMPVKNLPYLNTAQAGTAISIKFAVGGYQGTQVLQANSPTSIPVSCPTTAPQNALQPVISTTSGLKSLGSSYTYNWRTSASWTGSCRMFVLTLADGSTHQALFRFMNASKPNAVKKGLGTR
jgi:hypothetical protein